MQAVKLRPVKLAMGAVLRPVGGPVCLRTVCQCLSLRQKGEEFGDPGRGTQEGSQACKGKSAQGVRSRRILNGAALTSALFTVCAPLPWAAGLWPPWLCA